MPRSWFVALLLPINKYHISADRITIEGMGATDKLSEEIDFNRVAMFIDTTK